VPRDKSRTKAQLHSELVEAHRRNAELEKAALAVQQERQHVQRVRQVMESIRAVIHLISPGEDINRRLQDICVQLVQSSGCRAAWIALLDEQGQLQTAAASTDGRAPMGASPEALPACALQALRHPDRVFVEHDLGTDPQDPQEELPEDRETLCIRLEHEGNILGMLILSVPIEVVMDKEVLGLFLELAQGLEIALDGLRERKSEREAVHALRRIETLHRILDILVNTADDTAYGAILKVLLEKTCSKHGVFGYLDEDGALVLPAAAETSGNGSTEPPQINVFPPHTWGNTAGARALREKQIICSNEPSGSAPSFCMPIYRQISVPVLYNDKVLALIQVANKDTDYLPGDAAFLEDIAGAMAPALEKRLFQQRQARTHQHVEETLQNTCRELESRLRQATHEIAQSASCLEEAVAAREAAVTRSQRLGAAAAAVGRLLQELPKCGGEEEIACAFLTVAQQLTGSAFGYFGGANPSGKCDIIATANPAMYPGEAARPETVRMKDVAIRGIWVEVLRDGHSHIFNGPIRDAEQEAAPKGYPALTSFLGVPLWHSGRIVGAIALANKVPGYGDLDQEIIEMLAPVLSMMLRHKRAELAVNAARRKLMQRESQAVLQQIAGNEGTESHGLFARMREAFRMGAHSKRPCDSPDRLEYLKNSGLRFHTVLTASPYPEFCGMVRAVLGDQRRINIVEMEDLADEGLRMAQELKPDTVVFDLNSAGMSGLHTMALLRDSLPEARIFGVSPYASKSLKIAARESGADALVVGTLHGRHLKRALRKAILRA